MGGLYRLFIKCCTFPCFSHLVLYLSNRMEDRLQTLPPLARLLQSSSRRVRI